MRKTGDNNSKRASAFNKSWLRDYPWLLYDDDETKGGVFCNLCMKYDKRLPKVSVERRTVKEDSAGKCLETRSMPLAPGLCRA